MSTEESGPGTATDGGARRRSKPAAAAVAVAVLLTGGGVYAAAAPGGGDEGEGKGRGTAAPARDGGGEPPPLRLDGFTGGREPGPGGGGVTYRAAKALPEGPDEAAVHWVRDPVAVADVAGLAEALGVSGKPRLDGDAWAVGVVADGSGPVLRVGREAPGTWTFARYGSRVGGGDNCRKVDRCSAQEPGGGAGDPSAAVSERAARAAAAPVLKELGLDAAKADAGQLMGAVRVVNAAPVYDGLPTYGWSTGVQVGSDGQVVGGSGQLTAPAKGDVYPVVGAQEALEQLNAEAAGDGPAGIGGCATTPPLQAPEVGGTPQRPCESFGTGTPGKRAKPLVVEKAVLGLAVGFVGGRQTLVPSWLFTVRPDGAGQVSTVPRTAVAPEYLARPEPDRTPESNGPTPPPSVPGDGPGVADGPRVESYRADGERLTVRFWGGVCADYAARAVEAGGSVRVEITGSEPEPGAVCVAMAKELTAEVALDAPLGERKVVDAGSGDTVARK